LCFVRRDKKVVGVFGVFLALMIFNASDSV
jgi:hypothetical protein